MCHRVAPKATCAASPQQSPAFSTDQPRSSLVSCSSSTGPVIQHAIVRPRAIRSSRSPPGRLTRLAASRQVRRGPRRRGLAQAAEPQALRQADAALPDAQDRYGRARRHGRGIYWPFREISDDVRASGRSSPDRDRGGLTTQNTAWGLPILTSEARAEVGMLRGCRAIALRAVSATASASGISRQPKRGSPISTRKTNSPSRRQSRTPALRLQPEVAPSSSAHQEIGDAARAVAASARLAAVIVVDAHEGGGVRRGADRTAPSIDRRRGPACDEWRAPVRA